MKLSTLFTINAIVTLLFGLSFLLAPVAALAPYGVTTDETGILLARLLGGAFLNFAVLTWFARNAGESDARRAIVLSFAIGSAIGFVVSLLDQLAGRVNALGWSTVAIYLLFTLGYGYFQFGKSASATA